MPNTFYVTSGLSVAKNAGQAPSSQENTNYVTAGLSSQIYEGTQRDGNSNLSTIINFNSVGNLSIQSLSNLLITNSVLGNGTIPEQPVLERFLVFEVDNNFLIFTQQ